MNIQQKTYLAFFFIIVLLIARRFILSRIIQHNRYLDWFALQVSNILILIYALALAGCIITLLTL